MAFSQMMVAISPVDMRYFATPKSSKHFNPTLCFHWADERVQTVDSAYIIALVGTKVKNRNGVRTIDDESLRIILEKIQELRNLGEKNQADILNNFLDDIAAEKISAEGNADEAFTIWRKNKCKEKVKAFLSLGCLC